MPSNTAIIGRVAVKVAPDTSDFRSDTERQLNRLEKSLRVEIPTTASMLGAKRDLLVGVQALSANAPKVRLKTEIASESLTAASGELDSFRKRVSPVRIDLDVQRGVAERVAASLAGVLAVVGRLAASGAQLGAVATGIAGIAAASLAGASNLFALSSSLAQIGPAALALPGILGGIASGLGVTIAALRDFNKVFPDVAAQFAEMQNLISKNFWAEAEGAMRRMIDTLLPQLSAGFGTTASALGGYFAGIADGVRTTLSEALTGMFADLAKSIDIAATGTGALVGIITTLGTVGAGMLPRLAKAFVEITTQFNGFLSRAAADGRLTQWIENGVTALRDLGSVLGGALGILNGIATAAAAAGGSSLAVLADALQRIADIVNGPAFQAGLAGVFSAAHEAMDRIATISGPGVSAFFASLGQTLTAVLPIAGEALGTALAALATALANVELQRGIVSLFEGFGAAVTALAPLLPPLGEALGVVAQVVGVGLNVAFQGVGAAIQAASGFLSEHSTVATVLAGVLAAVLVPALAAWGAASVLNSVTAARAWITTATAAQTSAVVQTRSAAQVAFAWVTQAASATLNGAKIALVWTAQIAAKAIAATAIHVAQVGIMVAKWVFLGAQSLLAAARVAAAWLIAMGPIALVAAAIIGLVILVIANWDTIKEKTIAVWNAVKSAMTSAASAVRTAVVEAFVAIMTKITTTQTAIKTKVTETWNDVRTAFSAGVAEIVTFVTSIPGKVRSAFGDARSILVNAGKDIIGGLLDGITSAFGKVKDKLNELTGLLPDWKGPAPVDRVLLFDAGRLIIGGLINGMESQYSGVRKSLTGLTKDIGSTLIDSPSMADLSSPRSGAAGIGGSLANVENGPNVIVQKTLVYNAAPGSSLNAEEDLFSAASRTRLVGW